MSCLVFLECLLKLHYCDQCISKLNQKLIVNYNHKCLILVVNRNETCNLKNVYKLTT